MRQYVFLSLLIGLCLYACDDSDDTPAVADTLDTTDLVAAQQAYQSPQTVFTFGNNAINSAAAVIYQAGLINGAVTTTGTLQETGSGFTYSPQPTDRFEYKDQTGQTVAAFTVFTLEGDITGDDQNFLNNSHRFEFQVDAPGQGDMRISSINNGQLRTIDLDGTIIHEGQPYTVDLLIEGTYFFDVDLTGAELDVDAEYTGTITGDNFVENVDENWQYNIVTATGQGGFTAENVFRSFNTAWTVDGTRFQYQNGVLQSVFRDGRPTEWDVDNSPWQAEGTLLVNDQAVGNLTIGSEGNFIKVWLQLGDRKEELTSWRLQ